MATRYLHYYLTAANGRGHGMHSPFVFDFILNVLQNRKNYQPPASLEELRKRLERDKSRIELEDLGAGSRTGTVTHRSVHEIARSTVKPKKYSQLLYRVVRHYQPQQVVELGTSLGITTAGLSLANPAAQVTTIEGSTAVHARAQKNFETLGLQNIRALNGNFDDLLPPVMNGMPKVDLAFIDGNHRREPTLRYFEQLLTRSTSSTILIFDDIHWSAEMEEAWKSIQQHVSVRCTIDIFFLGFVFFSPSFKNKQHFVIRY